MCTGCIVLHTRAQTQSRTLETMQSMMITVNLMDACILRCYWICRMTDNKKWVMNDGIWNVLSYRLKTSNAQTTSKCPKMIRVRVSGRKKVIGRTGRAPVAWKSLLFSFSLIVESEGKKKAGRVLKMSRCVLWFFFFALSLSLRLPNSAILFPRWNIYNSVWPLSLCFFFTVSIVFLNPINHTFPSLSFFYSPAISLFLFLILA